MINEIWIVDDPTDIFPDYVLKVFIDNLIIGKEFIAYASRDNIEDYTIDVGDIIKVRISQKFSINKTESYVLGEVGKVSKDTLDIVFCVGV